MAFGSNTIGNIAGAVGDLFSSQATAAGLHLKAKGSQIAGENYRLAAGLAGENAAFVEGDTNVKTARAERQLYLGLGQEISGITGSGFRADTGTSLDLLRSSVEQGALERNLINIQGTIQEDAFKEQQKSYNTLASYSEYAAGVQNEMAGNATTSGWINAGLKGAAALASIFL